MADPQRPLRELAPHVLDEATGQRMWRGVRRRRVLVGEPVGPVPPRVVDQRRPLLLGRRVFLGRPVSLGRSVPLGRSPRVGRASLGWRFRALVGAPIRIVGRRIRGHGGTLGAD